ncbi:MAG TPA: hypothetical protein VLJ17_24670 [Xanthobacteraceae bacterium]|nr:hypothetical protein [Xanthobacteraceae bacterium]
MSLCGLAQHVFKRPRGAPGPCPALEHGDHETQCGLVANPQHYVKSISKADAAVRATAAKYLIGAGLGCTAVFNGEPRDEVFDRMITMRALGGAMRAAMRAWGLVV